jgi:hypothetical protein
MNKVELLKQRAEEFYALLEKYAEKDSDVADFKRLFKPWYEKIQRGDVTPPCYEYKLGGYFTNSDLSPLADRYFHINPSHPLAESEVRFNEAIRDRLSDLSYLKRLRDSGEEPSAILTPLDIEVGGKK